MYEYSRDVINCFRSGVFIRKSKYSPFYTNICIILKKKYLKYMCILYSTFWNIFWKILREYLQLTILQFDKHEIPNKVPVLVYVYFNWSYVESRLSHLIIKGAECYSDYFLTFVHVFAIFLLIKYFVCGILVNTNMFIVQVTSICWKHHILFIQYCREK